MPSLISWLDASAEEQRRMRELVALFSFPESRDELGLGQIRDATSDALFPGTSTLHTRARYALFVPWCFERAANSRNPRRRLDEIERNLIGTLSRSTDNTGLLGATAGRALKNLPSTVYWSMLERWEILAKPSNRAEALVLSKPHVMHSDGEDGAGSSVSIWTTPPAPHGFPESVDDGFSLRRHEAEWMRDRILDCAGHTLLAHLATERPNQDSPTPWDDPAAIAAPDRARNLLEQARMFSIVMHGAQLLYNLLLAQRCEADEVGPQELRGQQITHVYREEIAQWAQAARLLPLLERWSIDTLLDAIAIERASPLPIAPSTRRFIQEWTRAVQRAGPDHIADDPVAQDLITQRERNKGPKARLGNKQRLTAWSGESGRGALLFRWPTVRTLLTDIHDGLERA